jgi:hypothetical protein
MAESALFPWRPTLPDYDVDPHDQLGSPGIISSTAVYFLWVATTLVCCTILSQFGRFLLCFCFLSFLSSDYAGYSLLIPNAHTQAVFILRFSEFFL